MTKVWFDESACLVDASANKYKIPWRLETKGTYIMSQEPPKLIPFG
jgi:hypothetical protein